MRYTLRTNLWSPHLSQGRLQPQKDPTRIQEWARRVSSVTIEETEDAEDLKERLESRKKALPNNIPGISMSKEEWNRIHVAPLTKKSEPTKVPEHGEPSVESLHKEVEYIKSFGFDSSSKITLDDMRIIKV
ncbi:hypothetical protein CYLTODRAFT_482287 [Cylindrobasidium torrendii FP15055 ss-10]|uniref:Uncharacterized protein n=1 Tax=Cylindrobasidium torrendii FP15055 ss-10 TaxID=1314674 RepID=A0A0D7ASM5_9AGAR|nr:hypothetical protein CYLTODRAFT_482287 [Cylindrobasidium torrendii FP15055 ss-10]